MIRVKNLARVAVAAALGVGLLTASNPAWATNLLSNVPEAGGYQLVYEFPIPVNSLGWNSTPIPYTVNNSGSIPTGSFDRVAYYLQLDKPGGGSDWVYVSMNTFTNRADKTGVPNTASGEFYNFMNMPSGWIANGKIFSNVAGIVTGTGINTINLEFWPSNYGQNNGYGVPGANGSTFDFGDGGAGTGNGHGSMQIHNYGTVQTLFAYNAWGQARTSELGIGNQVGGSGNPDWTFNTSNISTYSSRTLQVLVTPEPSTAMLVFGGVLALWNSRRRNRRR